jgi:predicted dehydrogenase
MSNKGGFGFGIIGCGMVADIHARAIVAMKGGHLTCVYSRSPKNAERIANAYGVAAYTNYSQFLAHPKLDVVTIATPSGAHLEPAQKAAIAGKHVIYEKPLEISLARIDKMIVACQKNKVMLAGILQRRYFEAVKIFKNAVDSGRLGKITLADAYNKWYRTQEYYDSRGWRGTWKLDGGGALMNQSIHTIDLLYYLAGDVEWVCSFADRTIHKRIETEDVAVAILKFKNGAIGVIEGSTSCYSAEGHPAKVQMCGSEGSIFLHDDRFSVWEYRKGRSNDKKIVQKFGIKKRRSGVGASDPAAINFIEHQRNFEDVVRSLKNGTLPMIDGIEGRKSVEIILAIYRSALAGGKPVSLPLKRTPIRKPFG